MRKLKILAISDIVRWEGYEKILDDTKPDVTILAGDLTSDGFASFWHDAVEQIPEFQKEKKKIMKKLGVVQVNKNFYSCSKDNRIEEWLDLLASLRKKYKKTKKFLEIRKKIHVDKFYNFLEYAGKKSKVLVVKGDHDEDFDKDYILEKINKIPDCKEITGRGIKVCGFSFIGLGFYETYDINMLNSIIEKFKGKVDIVITHCKQNRLPLISLLKPKLIIRGHFGSGKYLVNEIPAVFTQDVKYTIIELRNKKFPKISQYIIDKNNKKKRLKRGSCKPLFSKLSEFEIYEWLEPYPEK